MRDAAEDTDRRWTGSRRDSIWLTEKDSEGATKPYPLNSFHPAPRKDENLLRKYMLHLAVSR